MDENFGQYFKIILDLLNYNIFTLGEAHITPLNLIYLIVLAGLLIIISGKIKKLLIGTLLQRTKLDEGAQQAVGTITRYIVLFIGFIIILQTVGINLTTLNVLAGAVGIGIGLGLQNIANNFISGVIIMFERPIKVGDRIEVGAIHGRVLSIGARSTSIRTNDNIAVIVPNSKFISENVTNWSFGTDRLRFRIPVNVAYDSDVDLVTKVLVDTAKANEDVLLDPPPSVRFLKFQADSLYFELRAWSSSKLHRPGLFKSNLNYAIIKNFREHGIEIPFPQRDIRIRTDRGDDISAKVDFDPA